MEIRLLLESVFQHYGADFRDYELKPLRRRIQQLLLQERVPWISQLQQKILLEPDCFKRFVTCLLACHTPLFGDPHLYLAFRQEVVPLLRTYPSVRIWHAGCASAEEAYAMAIVLYEEGLSQRCRLYATDLNEVALEKGREGLFPLEQIPEYTRNYQKAGGQASFSDYYTIAKDQAVFQPALRKNMLLFQHNLATDGSFNSFHVIFCRNVLSYFNNILQVFVYRLLYESLFSFGLLILGRQESLQTSPYQSCFREMNLNNGIQIYRRIL